MDKTNFSIGFFDSGVGGISVLKESIKLLPKENYIYIGDSLNAPYGVKTPEEVRKLTFNMVDKLISMNVKAIVVACNTATSIAIDELRKIYKEIPIIGIEPALKPAIENYGNGIIVIMATPVTLSENKFSKLRERYNKASDIISMPCDGLVEIIEDGNIKGEVVEGYLRNRFKDVPKEKVSSVVLGCTHYPFIKEALVNVINDDVAIIDGSLGTVKQLKRKLEQKGLLNTNNEQGTVKIFNSKDDENLIELSYKLLDADKNSK
ncbi:glutamate racemase [Clostridium subterminale]|uniref:Glutamate racemase n=1 Tax=Clostridium subterminale TaxID=1550 RepID=A0ABP3VWQ0_CLOSU